MSPARISTFERDRPPDRALCDSTKRPWWPRIEAPPADRSEPWPLIPNTSSSPFLAESTLTLWLELSPDSDTSIAFPEKSAVSLSRERRGL